MKSFEGKTTGCSSASDSLLSYEDWKRTASDDPFEIEKKIAAKSKFMKFSIEIYETTADSFDPKLPLRPSVNAIKCVQSVLQNNSPINLYNISWFFKNEGREYNSRVINDSFFSNTS